MITPPDIGIDKLKRLITSYKESKAYYPKGDPEGEANRQFYSGKIEATQFAIEMLRDIKAQWPKK